MTWLPHPAAPVVTDGYVGSPMYSIFDEHRTALVLVLLMVIAIRPLRPRLTWTGYGRLDHPHRLAFWLLAASAVVHFGLAAGHEDRGSQALYLGAAASFGVILWMMIRSVPRWRAWTIVVLIGSLAGYAISMLAGEAPDQLGLATKLVELTALAIVVTPHTRRTRLRLLTANVAVVGSFVLIGSTAWLGAFAGGGGHHLGEVPPPGVLIPQGEDRAPTLGEQIAYDELLGEVRRLTTRFDDITVAAEHGYDVDGIRGSEFHAVNPAHKGDGRYFDPARPENLIYGLGHSGDPVLLGVMFEMDGIRQAGPAVGGPLTVWHAHDHVCLTVLGLGPLVSPWGGCPIGHVSIPITNEMLHVWLIPGLEEPVGDVEDSVVEAYLAAH